jgi:hypothetical protein
MTDAGLKGLNKVRSLKTVDLRGTQITDAGINELKGLENLKELNLCWLPGGPKEITAAGVKELQAALPDVTILR